MCFIYNYEAEYQLFPFKIKTSYFVTCASFEFLLLEIHKSEFDVGGSRAMYVVRYIVGAQGKTS
jgi:hypothetical protein